MVRSKVIKVLRWIPFCVVGVELVLLLTGVLSVAQAAVILVTLEIALAFMLVIELAALRAGFRYARKAGASRSQAMTAALEYALPKPVAVMVLQEFRVFGAFFAALNWRRRRLAPDWSEVSYHGGLRTLVLILVSGSALVGLAAALLVPVSWLRWLLMALAVYWVLASLGYGALMRSNPHLVSRREIRLRLGKTVDVGVPADGITDVRLESHSGARSSYLVNDETLVVSVMGKTNIAVSLTELVPVESRRFSVLESNRKEPDVVQHVRFFADNPQHAVSVLRGLVT